MDMELMSMLLALTVLYTK